MSRLDDWEEKSNSGVRTAKQMFKQNNKMHTVKMHTNNKYQVMIVQLQYVHSVNKKRQSQAEEETSIADKRTERPYFPW